MEEKGNSKNEDIQKNAVTVSHKNLESDFGMISANSQNENSLSFWASKYFELHVFGGKQNTIDAKKRDIEKFLNFFSYELKTDNIDFWTVSISKEFQKRLFEQKSEKTGESYKATTVNRIIATLKHFASWVENHKVFVAGNPFKGVGDLMQDEPEWKGLDDRQLMLLRGACDQRLAICKRKDQNPLLELTVFYVLLHTGLRESELCNLDLNQYKDGGFYDVKRKGKMITKKVFLPTTAREKLDEYLEGRGLENGSADIPLLTVRTGARLAPRDVRRICERLVNQACVQLPSNEKFGLTPHQLRHTFLKRITDKHGVHRAKKVSGNVGIRQVFRYSQPSQDEIEKNVEELFG